MLTPLPTFEVGDKRTAPESPETKPPGKRQSVEDDEVSIAPGTQASTVPSSHIPRCRQRTAELQSQIYLDPEELDESRARRHTTSAPSSAHIISIYPLGR